RSSASSPTVTTTNSRISWRWSASVSAPPAEHHSRRPASITSGRPASIRSGRRTTRPPDSPRRPDRLTTSPPTTLAGVLWRTGRRHGQSVHTGGGKRLCFVRPRAPAHGEHPVLHRSSPEPSPGRGGQDAGPKPIPHIVHRGYDDGEERFISLNYRKEQVMRLTCDRTALVDRLNILARGVSTRSALPVLSGVLLQAVEGRLDLYSTDMELSIKASLTASVTIESDGEVVVPARLFSDVVRNLSADEVVVDAAESAVKVAGGRAEFALNAWSAADFPQTSTFDMSDAFTVGRDPFALTLGKVGRAASRDETRPILTGVLVSIAGDTLKMVATDSYRLAVKETRLEAAPGAEVQAIVPAKALTEVARLAAALGEGHRGRRHREPGRLPPPRPERRRVARLASHRRAVPELQAAHPGDLRPPGAT
ncbi:MAG: DNA polymerase III subunit beta, partial [Actinomycetota bacterium]